MVKEGQDRPLFRASAESALLEKALADVAPGQTITYIDLNKACKSDVQSAARSALQTARRHLEREQRITFEALPNFGLKRLDQLEIVGAAAKHVRSVRRKSRRAVVQLACADYDKLPLEARSKHDAYSAFWMITGRMSEARGVIKIEAASSAQQKQISVDQTLDLFRDKSDGV